MTGLHARKSLSGPLFAAELRDRPNGQRGGLQKANDPPETASKYTKAGAAARMPPIQVGSETSFLLPMSTGPPQGARIRSRSEHTQPQAPQVRAASGTGGAFYPGSPARRVPDRSLVGLNRVGSDAFNVGPGKWGTLPPAVGERGGQGFLGVSIRGAGQGSSKQGVPSVVPPVRMGPLGLQGSASTPSMHPGGTASRPWSAGAANAGLVGLAAAERRLHSTAETSTGIKLQMRHMIKDLSNMQDRNTSARRHIGNIKEVEALEKDVDELKSSVGSIIVSARQEIFEYFARVQSDLDFLDEDVGKLTSEHDAMQDVLSKMHARVSEFEKMVGHS